MSNSLEEEMIALRWNNHMATMSQLLFSLREEESMIDVTLACDGKLLPAHKFVLSMCSDYFKEMFTSNPCKHPIVFLKDVHCEDLEALLDFMYRGVVHIQKAALSSMLKTAEGLQIRGLGLFATADGVVTQQQQQQQQQHQMETSTTTLTATTISTPIVERLSLTGLEPSVFLSPDRKRSSTYDLTATTVSNDPTDPGSSLTAFSEVDLDEHSLNTSSGVSHSTAPPSAGSSPHKKSSQRMIDHPPAAVPDLPKVNEDQLDIGCGVTISAADYMKLRRTNANRYINDLLRYFFSLEVLAMSSLTGGECFANRGKTHGSKNQLDPSIIRVITHDAIRNFPMISEKQVRNAIRRKLNTESRTFRGLGKVSSGVRRPPTKRRPRQTPRAHVSIERSSHSLHAVDNKPQLMQQQHQQQSLTPNVTLEKTTTNTGLIFRTKDSQLTPTSMLNRIGQQGPTQQQQQLSQQQQQQQQQQQYGSSVVQQQQTITTVGGVTATVQGISLSGQDKRSDDEAAAASAAAYFNSTTAGTSRGGRERTPPPSHHTSTSNTPPLVATSLPPSSSPSTTISEKTFNLVKAEVGGAGGTQYLSQEYSYLPHVSQPPTAYIPHHMNDPAYLRRLEMSQAAAVVQHATPLAYSYAPLPTSESMEPSLHM